MQYEEVTGVFKTMNARVVQEAADKLHAACEDAKCTAAVVKEEIRRSSGLHAAVSPRK